METKESDYVTKDYLTAELTKLHLQIEQKLNEQFRYTTAMILGTYAMIALGYFIK